MTITYPIRTLKHCAPEAFVVVDDEGGMARYVERLVADEKLSREHVLLAAGRLESDNFTDDELIQTVAGIAANPEADTSERLESLKASRPIGGFVADASARSSIHLVRSVDYSPAKGPTCCESCGNRTEARAPDVLDLRHDPTDRGARKNAAVGAQLLPLSRAARGLPVGTRAIAMTKTNMGSGSPPTRMWPRYRQRQRSPAMVGFAYSSQTPLDVPRLAEVLSFKVREGPRTEMGHTEA